MEGMKIKRFVLDMWYVKFKIFIRYYSGDIKEEVRRLYLELWSKVGVGDIDGI